MRHRGQLQNGIRVQMVKTVKRTMFLLSGVWVLSICLMGFNLLKYGDGREAKLKVKSEIECNTDCVIDDEGWIGDPDKLGKQLKNSFFNVTGVQPFIKVSKFLPYFNAYEEGQAYAEEWYNNNISNQQTFLLMYFPEKDPNQKGVFKFVVGEKLQGVITEDFIEEMSGLLEDNWLESSDVDEMLLNIYKHMGKWLIKGSPSSLDVNKRVLTISVGVTLVIALLSGLSVKRHLMFRNREEYTRKDC